MVTLTDLLDLADADAFLEGLPGNIVKGHGRKTFLRGLETTDGGQA
jgi:hypothetical protein